MSDTKYKQLASPQAKKKGQKDPLEKNTPSPWNSQSTLPEQASFYRYYWLQWERQGRGKPLPTGVKSSQGKIHSHQKQYELHLVILI